MNISRILITRKHLKAFKKCRIYDGLRKYKQPKTVPEIDSLTVAVIYDIYSTMIKNSSSTA